MGKTLAGILVLCSLISSSCVPASLYFFQDYFCENKPEIQSQEKYKEEATTEESEKEENERYLCFLD